MTDNVESLNELAREINAGLVRLGRANWRREFNAKLWACNRDKALALIGEYRDKLIRLAGAAGWDEIEQLLFSPLQS